MKFAHSLLLSFLIATLLVLSGAVSAQEQTDPVEGLKLPGLSEYAPDGSESNLAQTPGQINLVAQLAEDAPEITRGLIWRIFWPEPGPDGINNQITHCINEPGFLHIQSKQLVHGEFKHLPGNADCDGKAEGKHRHSKWRRGVAIPLEHHENQQKPCQPKGNG